MGAAGAAVAVNTLNATQAHAANGDAIVAGQSNTATSGTTLNGSNAGQATLALSNSAGAGLRLNPTDATPSSLVTGDLIGRETGPEVVVDYGEGPESTYLATAFDLPPSTIAFSPERVMDTRSASFRNLIVDSSASWADSSKRVKAGAWIDIALAMDQPGLELHAAFLNVTAIAAPARGNLVVFPSGDDAPTASNLNYPATTSIANMCFVAPALVDDVWCVRVKVNVAAAHVILDFSGAVGYFPGSGAVDAARSVQGRRQKAAARRGDAVRRSLVKGLNLPG